MNTIAMKVFTMNARPKSIKEARFTSIAEIVPDGRDIKSPNLVSVVFPTLETFTSLLGIQPTDGRVTTQPIIIQYAPTPPDSPFIHKLTYTRAGVVLSSYPCTITANQYHYPSPSQQPAFTHIVDPDPAEINQQTPMSPEVIVSIVFGVIASLLAIAGVVATLYRHRKQRDADRATHSEGLLLDCLREQLH
ncbi:hypothetical protein PG997_014161 [Apiospora hydei]|uniref:Uncharacterized protein n=1 Tax=Apiospora hydei TaxID=1337664 RepID=A0ABR1UT00_9PEZI